MSTFANQLKTEISRIAKKEARSQTSTLKKSSTQHRTDIAALKKRIAHLEGLVKKLSQHQTTASVTHEQDSSSNLRFRPSGFSALRKKFKLNADQMGQLIGVSAQSIYHWEAGKSKPRNAQLTCIAQVRQLTKKQARDKLGL